MLAFDDVARKSAEDLLTTTRSVRKRLDLTRDVDLKLIRDCLQTALQAPTGANLQQWRWIVVRDPAVRARVAGIYREAAKDSEAVARYAAQSAAAFAGADPDQMMRTLSSVGHLAKVLAEVPVLVVPCMVGAFAPDLFSAATLFGSIYPAVWSFQLALRTHGLGTVLTTAHLAYADRMGDVLGIPEGVTQAGLLPVAYITGERLGPAKRLPVGDVTYLDHWSDPI